MDWNAIAAIAAVVSTTAIVFSALYVRAELKGLEKDRYLAVTNQMFAIWETHEFMNAQLWLLHRLTETTWSDFVRAHRADVGEAAFHRVGSYYDRLGALVRLGVINGDQILPTIGGYAIAVWQKIQPLVYEARRLEHSTLFTDFERLLPSCYECYVPSLTTKAAAQPAEAPADGIAPRIAVAELKRRLDRGDPLTVVDARPTPQVAAEPQTLPGAVLMPEAEAGSRLAELPAGQDVVVYCA